MECTCPALLPSCHIGNTADGMTGLNVILGPYRRKENQCVMNHQQSTSISGKHHPENHKGEGNTPSALKCQGSVAHDREARCDIASLAPRFARHAGAAILMPNRNAI